MPVLALVSSPCSSAFELVDVWLAGPTAVEVVLLDAAAATARVGHPAAAALERVLSAGAVVLVSDEAASRRGITGVALLDGVKTVTLDEVADLIGDTSATVVWL